MIDMKRSFTLPHSCCPINGICLTLGQRVRRRLLLSTKFEEITRNEFLKFLWSVDLHNGAVAYAVDCQARDVTVFLVHKFSMKTPILDLLLVLPRKHSHNFDFLENLLLLIILRRSIFDTPKLGVLSNKITFPSILTFNLDHNRNVSGGLDAVFYTKKRTIFFF